MFQASFNVNEGMTVDLGEFEAVARVAFSKGEVGMLDLANSDGDVSNNNPGELASGFSNVVSPTSGANTTAAIHVVALEDIAQDARGKFAVHGIVQALCGTASGNMEAGDSLWVNQANGVLTDDPATGIHVKAVLLEDLTAPGASGALANVLLSGFQILGVGQ